METRTCQNCKTAFILEPDDLNFYQKIGVQEPRMCPACRARQRLAFRNERVFYKRPCDLCKKNMVSMYSSNKPYVVWCNECWFSDNWDALEYEMEYNPSKSFFEQFAKLWKQVPKVGLIYMRSVNSEYTNISADSKNCYMIVESSNNESCVHCYWIQQCKDLVDVSFSHKTEFSYECDDCYNSYRLLYGTGCHDCQESYFLLDCRDCINCVACVNVRNKKYCIFNMQVTKEEYERFLKNARLDTYSGVETLRQKFIDFVKTQPKKYAQLVNAPACSGNYINNAQNCRSCFHCYDAQNNKYGVHVWRNAKDCMDVDTAGRGAQLIYNSINAGVDVSHYICCAVCWTCSFMQYSYYCFNSNNCFGSCGLRKKEYCILNKQYDKTSHIKLRDEIITNMKTEGEYGEFFPQVMSTFGYNESAAQEQFPLTKEEARAAGFKWEDTLRGTYGKETVMWNNVPDSINEFESENIVKEVFVCTSCKKNYLVIPDEFTFYKRLGIPLPRMCPECRHTRRFAARGPNKVWERQCDCNGEMSGNKNYRNLSMHAHELHGCPTTFLTNLASSTAPIVYCESCFNNEVV